MGCSGLCVCMATQKRARANSPLNDLCCTPFDAFPRQDITIYPCLSYLHIHWRTNRSLHAGRLGGRGGLAAEGLARSRLCAKEKGK